MSPYGINAPLWVKINTVVAFQCNRKRRGFKAILGYHQCCLNFGTLLLFYNHYQQELPLCSSIAKGTFHLYYTPRFNEVERGVYWYHLVRLSVCPSVDRIVSALYLQQYSSDPFHICTSYQATSEGVSRVMLVSKFKNFGILANLLNL